MNPHMRHPGFGGQMPAPGMMPQQMVNPMPQQQMNMMGQPMTNNQMVGMRMGGGAGMRMRGDLPPPSYNQALSHSMQNRAPMNQPVHPRPNQPRQSKQPTEKEKYFMQQRAKLKQFGKGTMSSSSLDPTKLVDSVFGTDSTKPRPKKQEQPVHASDPGVVDDGFGDFLSNSSSGFSTSNTGFSAPLPAPNFSMTPDSGPDHLETSQRSEMGSVGTNAPTGGTNSSAKAQSKDLSKMMLESCDLNAPAKSQGFHKPTLKEINPADRHNAGPHHHNVSNNARVWQPSDELTQLFSTEEIKTAHKVAAVKKTGKRVVQTPAWLTDTTQQHPIYRQVLEASLVDSEISTARLYPILLLSGLQKEVLGHLWSMCNKTTPGKLTVPELVHLLALIALTQNNIRVESTDILRQVPQCPVPFLASPSVVPSSGPAVLQSTDMHGSQPSLTNPNPTQSTATNMMEPVGGHDSHPTQPNFSNASSMQGTDTGHIATSSPAGSLPGFGLPVISPSSSAPAMLPVTQLPTQGIGQTSSVVTAADDFDDDYADFQAATVPTPSETTPTVQSAPTTSPSMSSSGAQSSTGMGDLMSGRVTSDILKSSTVDSFFGSDNSSETTSPDDDYFDGYKSADSKPSDSTSQFSTDQSDGDDFKNFDTYLDEFQRKRDQQDKESPLHRPISKLENHHTPQIPPITSETPKILSFPTPPKYEPAPHTKHMPSLYISAQETLKIDNADDFSDFADFHSAPFASQTTTTTSTTQGPTSAIPGPKISTTTPDSKPTVSMGLVSEKGGNNGNDDKYAALRMDFSQDLMDNYALSSPPTTQTTAPVPVDDWADFSSSADVMGPSGGDNLGGSGKMEGGDSLQTSWQGSDVTATEGDDWANFQDSNTFNTSNDSTTNKPTESMDNTTEDTSGNKLVNVKKESLNTSEILGLFKVKSDPVTNIKSRDDSFNTTGNFTGSLSESGRASSKSPDSLNLFPSSASGSNNDFMDPPPIDNFCDDDQDEFSQGYDFDDILKADNKSGNAKKRYGGIYGANENVVLDGHKTKDHLKSKLSDPQFNTESDNDSDSVRDFDMMKGQVRLQKPVEDSQSIASLEFVVNKNLSVNKDSDAQSHSSAEFGNFDMNQPKEVLPESRSLDSLDLKTDVLGESVDVSIQENQSGDTINSGSINSSDVKTGVIPEDRYSAIFSQEPSSRGDPSMEWLRCLESCNKMIQKANNIFNSIDSSDVCNEVVRTDQGTQYIEGVIEIYRIVKKITTSMENTDIRSNELTKCTMDINLAWNNLTAFLVGASVMPDPSTLEFSPTGQTLVPCSLCLLNIDMKTDNDTGKLSYAGNQYHASCANFWINCVDSCLPALKVPKLT